MFKLEFGKKYVCRNGEVRELVASPFWKNIGRIYFTPDGRHVSFALEKNEETHFVFHDENPNGWDIVAEYVEKKPRKASSPFKKLLTAKNGDEFILKGESFSVKKMVGHHWRNGEIFLVSKERKNDDGYEPIHVRNRVGVAVFGRQELIDLLRSGKYTVS